MPESASTGAKRRLNPAGGYVFPNYAAFLARQPSSYQQGFLSSGTQAPISHPDVNEFAFYAQDAWRLSNRLTLNLGLRYDVFNQLTFQPDRARGRS